MDDKTKDIYFSNEALAKFVAAEGKTLEKVICHLWQNNLNPNEALEIIDNVELHFTDGQKLTISCNEEGDGLDVIDFNPGQTARELREEFDGKIKLFQVNASTTKMWEDVIGKKLVHVRVTKQNDFYKADSVMVNFGEEGRTISIAPLDGLIIDYYEED
ncbi:MAG: hypothetical protein H0W61_03820 [Bacteroidetes bacterium]|nr:hypothetical protein [Bacteroidota bacterium]